MTQLEIRLGRILMADDLRMQALADVAAMALPEGAIGAGFIRTAVWDALTGRTRTPVEDVDVLYFDPEDTSTTSEARIEAALRARTSDLPWSVRNQARMHTRNGDRPYASLEDALRHWLETPTCVAVRINADEALEIVAPFGLEDLFAMRIRPTPRGRERANDYRQRIATKNWATLWPEAEIELP